MSLSQLLFKNIDDTIHLFINQIASKHNLNEDDLLKLWKSENIKNETKILVPVSQTIVQAVPVLSEKSAQLLKLDKKELVELCKTKKLKIGGTKKDIVDRILKYDDEELDDNKTEKKKIVKNDTPAVVKKLVEKIPPIQIRKNEWNNFEHSETSLVFNNKTQKIYGRQNKDGTISKLTKNDIDLCNKFKFAYTIPDNLNKKEEEDILDVKIKDLDEDDEEYVVEEEVEEENLKDDDDEEFELEEEMEDEDEEYYEEE